ncbi:hypothetical protein BD311DRAFT_742896 [Dichomitus squalens]|uniref:DUF6533 domain-containing protein n=1 Tax=Dichomitus squalens TaxID=114155 RepID=A0A4Q9M6M4_9APHY|nr:hypothetical protein BD311DRAFT_742896 [Dichomitus squalens]
MASSQTAQLAAEYSSATAYNYCDIAAAVVFLYDSMITTGGEIRCFWGRKITGAAILFWLNKYITALYLVWELATGLSISNKVTQFNGLSTEYCSQSCPCSCALSVRGINAVEYFTFMVLAAFTAIRVYALRRSLTLCAITAVLSLAPLGVDFVRLAHDMFIAILWILIHQKANFRIGLTGENIFPFGCTDLANVSISLAQIFTIIARSCVIAADCLAIGVTWFILGLQYPAHRGGVLKGSISRVLLIDGTIYFLILGVLNSLHLAFTLLSININALGPTSVMTAFTVPYSASLRAVGSIRSSQISSLHLDHSLVFERVVGSLGASISPEDYLKEDHGDGDAGESGDEPTETSEE